MSEASPPLRPRPVVAAALLTLACALALPGAASAQAERPPAVAPAAAPDPAPTPAVKPAEAPAPTPAPGTSGDAGASKGAGAPAVKSGLTADLMYRILIGDVAMQRGEPAVAARAYFEAAREARDPVLARRATEIGLMARQKGLAVEAAKLWSELDPSAERPKQVIATAGSGGGARSSDAGDDELKTQLDKALAAQAAASPAALAEAFLQLNNLLAQESDRAATYKLIAAVAEPYPTVPEAHYAVALAALHAGLKDMGMRASAMRSVDRALALKPGWERAVVLKSEILAVESPAAAIAFLEGAVKADPASKPLSGALAQLYIEQKRYADARAMFERLWEQDKSAREFEFGAAVLSVQMKDWATAERLLLDLKSAGYGENGVVEFHLAQVAEEQGRYDLAIERYRAVPEGERQWQGRLRIAAVMAKQQRVDEARKYLRELPAVTIDEKVQVRQTEAQLLRDAGEYAAAYKLLTQALDDFPDNPDLLYDTAMVAEKLDRIDVAEARLKRLIELSPDNAQALNALGYTLVDRTTRTQEGHALIEKALKLSPDDPFILDSMGWALFRLGKLDAAETYLRRAMAERPDAEIAAHLGEVLWVKGDRASAKEVWQSQLKSTPDNPVLLDTVRRLAP